MFCRNKSFVFAASLIILFAFTSLALSSLLIGSNQKRSLDKISEKYKKDEIKLVVKE